MKKAVLYARVSSDAQRKEGTIESQIEELKKQITQNGDILVKEYIDDGFSGAQLDRPAMDLLRNELKTNIFETIYFLNTDRIAREVTYQTIIIAEILKNKKQIIINGKDYVHNPENKFTLTVLGAVSELERAKIIERGSRGRQMKIRQGFVIGAGANIFGYDYHRKSPNTPAHYTINESESEIVKYIFENYTNRTIGLGKLCKELEEKGFLTKTGKKLWRVSILKGMLRQEMYVGVRYYNMLKTVHEYANPALGISKSRKRNIKRERTEWVPVNVPAILTKELYEKARTRCEWNRTRYRNPNKTQLLSNLTKCGYCGHSGFAMRRYYVDKRSGNPIPHHIESYKCNYRFRTNKMHTKNADILRCQNKEIRAHILENQVDKMIQENMLDECILSTHMEFFKRKTKVTQEKIQSHILKINDKISEITNLKQNLIDLYIAKSVDQEIYSNKNFEYDNEINKLKLEKMELLEKIPTLHKTDVVENALKDFCNSFKIRYAQANDFESRRKLFLENIQKVVFFHERIELHGQIQINQETKLPFCVVDKIPRNLRVAGNRRTYNSSHRITMVEFKELEERNEQFK